MTFRNRIFKEKIILCGGRTKTPFGPANRKNSFAPQNLILWKQKRAKRRKHKNQNNNIFDLQITKKFNTNAEIEFSCKSNTLVVLTSLKIQSGILINTNVFITNVFFVTKTNWETNDWINFSVSRTNENILGKKWMGTSFAVTVRNRNRNLDATKRRNNFFFLRWNCQKKPFRSRKPKSSKKMFRTISVDRKLMENRRRIHNWNAVNYGVLLVDVFPIQDSIYRNFWIFKGFEFNSKEWPLTQSPIIPLLEWKHAMSRRNVVEYKITIAILVQKFLTMPRVVSSKKRKKHLHAKRNKPIGS